MFLGLGIWLGQSVPGAKRPEETPIYLSRHSNPQILGGETHSLRMVYAALNLLVYGDLRLTISDSTFLEV